jgi:hypothetical protein
MEHSGRRIPLEELGQCGWRERGELFQVEGRHTRHERRGLTRARKGAVPILLLLILLAVVVVGIIWKGSGAGNIIPRTNNSITRQSC